MLFDNTKQSEADIEKANKLKAMKRKILEDNYTIDTDVTHTLADYKKIEDETSKAVYFPGEDGMHLFQTYDINGNKIETVFKTKCKFFDVQTDGIKKVIINNKIPKELIEEIINTFNDVCLEYGEEAAAQIYRKPTGEYFIHYPKQKISGAQVSYPDDPDMPTLRAENELVCELHSHNTMGAFWSGTDDANEKEVGFYVVIGKFNPKDSAVNESQSYKCRCKVMDSYIDLRLCDVFDMTEDEEKTLLLSTSRKEGNKIIFDKIERNPISTYYTHYNYYGSEVSEGGSRTYFSSETTKDMYRKNNPYFDRKYSGYSKVIETSGDDKLLNITYNYMKDTHQGEISFATKELLETVVMDYNYNSLPSSDRYMALIGQENGMCSNADYFMSSSYYSLNDGYSLSSDDDLDCRIVLRVLQLYSLTTSFYENTPTQLDLSTPKKMMAVIGSLDQNTEFYNSDYSLPIFWETLNGKDKSTLAYVLGDDVISLGRDVYNIESTNFGTICLLYAILMSDPFKREAMFQRLLDTIVEDTEGSEDLETSGMIERINLWFSTQPLEQGNSIIGLITSYEQYYNQFDEYNSAMGEEQLGLFEDATKKKKGA